MPIFEHECLTCMFRFDIITTVKWSDKCPKCGGNSRRLISKPAEFVYTKVANSHDANLIHQSHMRRKKQLDARAGDIKTGELDLKLQGPKEYWPDVTKEKNLH